MMYLFNQNNSGGYFTGPTLSLVIEADNEGEARTVAEDFGIDFDGPYCRCCGPRWYCHPQQLDNADDLSFWQNHAKEPWQSARAKEANCPAIVILRKNPAMTIWAGRDLP